MEELKQKVYDCAREGKEGLLDTILKNKSHKEIQIALNHTTRIGDEALTPLLVACKNVHTGTVKLLLETYMVFADQTGKVLIEDEKYENVTSLWITGYTGNIEIAKLLLLHGANINYTTATLSTALRAATYEQHTELIELFINEKADVNAANRFGHVILMNIDGKKESAVKVAQMLLHAGANPNHTTSQDGRSALHSYALHGSAALVEELFKWGAFPDIRDTNNITPIEVACEEKKGDIVTSLLHHKSFTIEQKLDYLELLASNYVFDDPDKCYSMLSRLMEERESKKVPKKTRPPLQIYENRTESKSTEELSKLKGNDHLLSLEALMIMERVLGTSHWYLPHNIKFRGAHLCDEGKFEKAFPLVLRCLDLEQHINKEAVKTLKFATAIMAQLITDGKLLRVQIVIDTFQKCLKEYQKCLTKGKSTMQTEVTHTAIQQIGLFTKVKYTPAERSLFMNLIAIFGKMYEKSGNQTTPLHYACQEETYASYTETAKACAFPNLEVLKLMLSSKCDPNVQDKEGNTPLHILVQYGTVTSEVATLKGAVTLFVDAKADVEIKNKAGENALQVAGKKIDRAIKENQLTPGLRKMVHMVKEKR